MIAESEINGVKITTLFSDLNKDEADKKITQNNQYVIYDYNGRLTNIYILASNIQDATRNAMENLAVIISLTGSRWYKIKRSYNGGVRG